jgi:hypothetical protein
MKGIDRVLQRLPHARRVGSRWQAPCPAHGGTKPNLRISEGDDGRVLLRCWSQGCTYAEITAAVGLRVADLFDQPLHPQALALAPTPPPTADEVENALQDCLRRLLDEESVRIGYAVPIVSRHSNRVREIISRLLHVELKTVAPAWWECEPHNNDPLWRTFAERALDEIMLERYGSDALVAIATMEDKMEAEERAAGWIHSEARREIQRDLKGPA